MNVDLIIKAINNDLNKDINAVISMIDASTIVMADYKKIMKSIERIDNNTFKKKVLDHIFIHSDDDVKHQMWLDDVVPYALIEKIFEDGFENVNQRVKQHLEELEIGEYPSVEVYFEGIEDIIVKSISHAKKSIYVAMSWFTNPKIFKVLLKQCSRIDVKLVINNDQINNNLDGLPFNELIHAGAILYLADVPELIHHKFCIIDNFEVINGSYNWTLFAEHHNKENIVILRNIPTVISSFNNQFFELTKQYESVEVMPSYAPKRIQYDPCSFSIIHSTELVTLSRNENSESKKRVFLKKALQISPDDYIRECIGNDSLIEELKNEIKEEEQLKIEKESQSIDKCKEKVNDSIDQRKKRLTCLNRKNQEFIAKSDKVKVKYNQAIEKVQSKRVSQSKKDLEIKDIKNKRRAEQEKIQRQNRKIVDEIEKNKNEVGWLTAQLGLLDELPKGLNKGANGLLRINLTWNTADDLDLHLVMPDGQEVMYNNKEVRYQGNLCVLDVDAIPNEDGENSQENIYWQNEIPSGIYKCKVELYNNKSGKRIIPFRISVYTENGNISTKTYTFTNAINHDQIEITDLVYEKKNKLKEFVFLGL